MRDLDPPDAPEPDLELDDPRPRPTADPDAPAASPLATRWRIDDREIVADQNPLNGAVRVWIGGRPVSANGFTIARAASSSYRGGEQAEARVRFDAARNAFSLWVDGKEIPPHWAPPPSPEPSAPQAHARVAPRGTSAPPHLLMIVLGIVFVVAFVVAILRFTARRDVVDTAALERRTAECLRRADQAAEDAKARVNDPQADSRIADERRLARIACKDRERECKRDPRSIPCVLAAP